jgi:hypothetical protein
MEEMEKRLASKIDNMFALMMKKLEEGNKK